MGDIRYVELIDLVVGGEDKNIRDYFCSLVYIVGEVMVLFVEIIIFEKIRFWGKIWVDKYVLDELGGGLYLKENWIRIKVGLYIVGLVFFGKYFRILWDFFDFF